MNCKHCQAPTGSDRPFCGKHIDNLPYVKLLQQYNKDRAAEAKISDRIINLNGLLAAEILEFLIALPREKADICLQTDLSVATSNRYLPALEKAGYIIQDWAKIDPNGTRNPLYRLTVRGLMHYRYLANLS